LHYVKNIFNKTVLVFLGVYSSRRREKLDLSWSSLETHLRTKQPGFVSPRTKPLICKIYRLDTNKEHGWHVRLSCEISGLGSQVKWITNFSMKLLFKQRILTKVYPI